MAGGGCGEPAPVHPARLGAEAEGVILSDDLSRNGNIL